MKNVLVSATILLATMGYAYAENPYEGEPANQVSEDKAFNQPDTQDALKNNVADQSLLTKSADATKKPVVYQDGSARDFDDEFGNTDAK
ncbi:hypothetical protein QLQ09_24345 [Brucella sp. NM4]|uniref:hypothetical protein n=1 Tax=Brucella sp. NM4 TaxID=3045175 RepID=UPI0024BCB084|nr:hypothetical protein [Brucella sp. NM4]WHS33870.1 hypothetical protein QLQ09_24345 [Brucella sp. NM4]